MNLTDKISKSFTLRDAVKSQVATRRGINNMPTAQHLENIKAVATNVLDKIVANFQITSFYRSRTLNTAIKGSLSSQHCRGEAVDIDSSNNTKLWAAIKQLVESGKLVFDQLIWEFGDDNEPDWIHISYSRKRNRGQVLKAYKGLDKLGKERTLYDPIKL